MTLTWPELLVSGRSLWEELLVEEHSMKTTVAPNVEDRREVPATLARLDRCVGDLIESVDSLASRIEPVLHSALPEEAQLAPAPSEAPSTEVGRSVDQAAGMVAGVALRLRELRDRVEL